LNEHRKICEIAPGSREYRAAVDLRDAVLRKPLGLRLSAEDLDSEDHSRHVACFLGDRLVACLVLRPLEGGDVRMRQVAVAPDLQRQGIGTELVEFSETLARQAGFQRMILHARESAVKFYKKLGYAELGDEFEEVAIPHWTMAKTLD
jgi:predicted GNAT family N-acyltransferase